MILVADSGSTKTDWILSLPQDKQLEFRSRGINPFFLSEKDIVKLLQNIPEINQYLDQVSEIYFFGAGSSSPDKHEIVSNGLSQVFKNAFISVESDIIGSVYATCGRNKGLTCILGTGSNISFFDGNDVTSGKHGLGFILGDEGSGTWFGKKLVTCFLYGKMPKDLSKLFFTTYGLTKQILINNVYQKPLPNFYLASFSKFMSENIGHPFIKDLLSVGFNEFAQTHILRYPDYNKYPCHFVGSVAYHFSDILKQVCKDNSIKVGKILEHPIGDLYKFIINKEGNSI